MKAQEIQDMFKQARYKHDIWHVQTSTIQAPWYVQTSTIKARRYVQTSTELKRYIWRQWVAHRSEVAGSFVRCNPCGSQEPRISYLVRLSAYFWCVYSIVSTWQAKYVWPSAFTRIRVRPLWRVLFAGFTLPGLNKSRLELLELFLPFHNSLTLFAAFLWRRICCRGLCGSGLGTHNLPRFRRYKKLLLTKLLHLWCEKLPLLCIQAESCLRLVLELLLGQLKNRAEPVCNYAGLCVSI